ncbi:MAG: hypothetical protein EA398_06970, partial [Deltaproteobacteria bacterium]
MKLRASRYRLQEACDPATASVPYTTETTHLLGDIMACRPHSPSLSTLILAGALVSLSVLASPSEASAQSNLEECPGGGFGTSLLPNAVGGLDDGSFPIDLTPVFPTGMDIRGTRFDDAWVNINGNITFESRLATFTPIAIPGLPQPAIAPFFADVDMRSNQGDILLCVDPDNSRMIITWLDVGYFSRKVDLLNSFQAILINTEGQCIEAQTFDVTFRYDRLEWTTGDASGGSGGLGGTPATAGVDYGGGEAQALPGSGTADVLDLVNLTNTGEAGVFNFRVAAGTLPTCGDGVLDLCEECDEGDDNSPTGACTPICTINVCGDGYLHIGVEECDGNLVDPSIGTACPEGFEGTRTCQDNCTLTPCDTCLPGRFGPSCEPCTCVNGTCDEGFERPGTCLPDTCETGWTGENCDVCPDGFRVEGGDCIACPGIDNCTGQITCTTVDNATCDQCAPGHAGTGTGACTLCEDG